MHFLLKISPPFLRKLDAYLRTNHAWIWATKIHIHTYLGIVLSALFALVGLLYHVTITSTPSLRAQDQFFILLFIPAIAFAACMVYNMSLFNPDKSAANRFRYQEFFVFLIYLFTFCLPLLIPFSAALVLNARIANSVTDEQLEKDKDAFNCGRAFLPVSLQDYEYYPTDSVYLGLFPKPPEDGEYSEEDEHLVNLRPIRDSVFYHEGVFSTKRPKLYFHHMRNWRNDLYYYLGRNSIEKYYTDISVSELDKKDSLYDVFIKNINITHNADTAKKYIAGMAALLAKYEGQTTLDQQLAVQHYLNNYYLPEGSQDAADALMSSLDHVEGNITNIHVAKFKYTEVYNKKEYMLLALFIFCFTLLFQVYKNVHWKYFLQALVIGVILLTLSIVFEVIFRLNDVILIRTCAVAPLLLLLISIRGFFIKKFSWFLTQVNIFLSVALPFYPIFILFYLHHYHHEVFTSDYFDRFKEYTASTGSYAYSNAYYDLIDTIWFWALWGGLLLYVLVWNSYLKALYLKYWSLPKDK